MIIGTQYFTIAVNVDVESEQQLNKLIEDVQAAIKASHKDIDFVECDDCDLEETEDEE